MKYSGLWADDIRAVFPGCLPCNCNGSKYEVEVIYGNMGYGNKGAIIREIVVTCKCCGLSQRYDVKKQVVFEKEIKWQAENRLT